MWRRKESYAVLSVAVGGRAQWFDLSYLEQIRWSCPTNYMVTNNPYPTAFPYGNRMVLHFYQQQESSTTKTVHKVINKGLKTYV